jgi:hypothetical protein
VRAGFLVSWLLLDVRGFRSVLARGWHGQLERWLRRVCDGAQTAPPLTLIFQGKDPAPIGSPEKHANISA